MKDKNHLGLALYDEFLELNFSDNLVATAPVDRRDFLKLLGTGILVLICYPEAAVAQARNRTGRSGRQLPDDFNAFLRIGEDGRVTGFTGKIEMGQGVYTSLAQMLADELNVPLNRVEMVMGDTDLCPWDMGTFGSMTTRFFGPPFRAAAAEARAVLLELASERLSADRRRLKVKDGVIYEDGSANSVTYGELAHGQQIIRRLTGEAVLEKPVQFSIVGTPVSRRDAETKVTGKALYAGDITEPGMLHARILRPPAHGAQFLKADLSEVRKLDGVRVVAEGDFIAVLHESPDRAEQALEKVDARFDRPKLEVNDRTIFAHLLKRTPEGETVAEGGDLARGEEASQILLEETYLNSYVAHAPIEPHAAVAKIENGKATIWASTQTPFRLKDQAAEMLGFPAGKVRVITPFVGGGFGGKSNNQQAIEAVRLAKLTGQTVQVAWTRAEEFFFDTFRPAAVVKVKAGVTNSGLISYWDYRVIAAGERGSRQFYNIPNHRTRVHGSGWRGSSGVHPLATGAWRAPANNTNTFARESHIDALAAKAGMDPFDFRIKNLKDHRMIRVLKAVAKKFGWKSAPFPSGRGVGVSLGIDAGTYVAHMAEVVVDRKTGKIRVRRVVCAQDMGLCINPEGAAIQMEGCITMGLGYALAEEIRFESGKVLDTNFDTYKIPRFSWLPEIETVILDQRNDPPQGGGEPAIVCMGAVLANAVFDATGTRLLQLPMTPARVKAALSAT